MGASSYVGRVGGLAVALGVGTAIATGNGVASADTTDSPPPPPSTNSSTTEPSTTDTQPVDPTTTPEASESPESDTTTETKTATTVTPGVVSAQTNTGTSGTTAEEEPAETADPEPTETEEPEPTETEEPNEEPGTPTEEPTAVQTAKPKDTAPTTAAEPSTTLSARTIQSSDPASASVIQEPANVAVFADARALAAAGPINVSPMMAATTPAPAPPPAPDLLTAAVNMVSSVVNWVLNPLAGAAPTTPAQPPLIWGLLAFARREFENFFNALSGRAATNTMLAAPQTTTSLALAATAVVDPYLPFPNAQVSPSTNFVKWVTGEYVYTDNLLLANTVGRYSVWGTDVGVMWDNGIPDNPATLINEHQILIALGDTFSADNMTGVWRPNTIFRSSDIEPCERDGGPQRPVVQRQHVRRRSAGPELDDREAGHLPRGSAGRGDAHPDGRYLRSRRGLAVRRGSVRELHVGVAVGRPGAVVDELLRDRLVRRQRRNVPRRTEHRAVQPAVGR